MNWDGKLFVAGEWRTSAGGKTLASLEKATGNELGTQALATAEDVNAAVEAAVAAQPGWAAQGYDVRAGVLRNAAALLKERAERYADLIVRGPARSAARPTTRSAPR